MNLVFKQVSEDQAVLALPIGFRLLFLTITSLLVAAMVSTSNVAAIPAVIAVLTILGALYQETWVFDRANRIIAHKYGLLVLWTTKKTSLDDVESFLITNYKELDTKGIPSTKERIASRSLAGFAAELTDGTVRQMDIRSNKHSVSLRQNAEQIAKFCGKPLRYQE